MTEQAFMKHRPRYHKIVLSIGRSRCLVLRRPPSGKLLWKLSLEQKPERIS